MNARGELSIIDDVETDRPAPLVGSPAPARELPAAFRAPVRPRGWLESSFSLMSLPLALTAGIMFAPLVWIFGSRQQR